MVHSTDLLIGPDLLERVRDTMRRRQLTTWAALHDALRLAGHSDVTYQTVRRIMTGGVVRTSPTTRHALEEFSASAGLGAAEATMPAAGSKRASSLDGNTDSKVSTEQLEDWIRLLQNAPLHTGLQSRIIDAILNRVETTRGALTEWDYRALLFAARNSGMEVPRNDS